MLFNQLFSSHPNCMVWHTAFGAWQRVTWSLHLPCMVRTLNLWWALNLVILVWWLGIRLMSLLAPGLQSSWLLIPTFILGSLVRCHHSLLSPGTRLWGLFFSGSGHDWFWTVLGFHPHCFHRDTRIGHILRWAWCHSLFSVFWVSLLNENYFWYF